MGMGIWRGDTTTPPLSAECQIDEKIAISLRVPRDTRFNKKPTKCQQNDQQNE